MTLFENLRSDPEFQALSVSDQIKFGKSLFASELAKDPAYQQLDFNGQSKVLNRVVAGLPTFEDPELDATATEFGRAYIRGDNLVEKQAREFFDSTVANSGIIGFVDQVFRGKEKAVDQRKRMLDYYKALDNLAGRSDYAGEIGVLAGNVADIVGVSLIMSPATGAARAGIQVAARGGKAMVAAAKAAKLTAPILKPMLNNFGPVLAESVIEAVPYLLADTQRRQQFGQPSLTDGSALDVAKTLGINAAADFLVGSLITATFPIVWKTGRAVFGGSEVYSVAKKTDEQINKLLFDIEVGKADESILQQLPEVEKAIASQRLSIARYMREGVADPDANQWGKINLLANDTKRIVSKNDSGFKVYEITKEGRPLTRSYESVLDAEDYLAYRFYTERASLDVDDLQKTLRPDNAWAYNRGKTLSTQQSLFSADAIKDSNPDFFKRLKETPKGWQDPYRRPIITHAEADALARKNINGITIKTQIPLRGSVVEAANSADVDLMKARGPLTVSISDQPNAVLIGTKAADQAAYDLASVKANKLIANEPFRTLEDARATLLLNDGFDYIAKADGTYEFFSPRNLKLLGADDDVILPFKKTDSGQSAVSAIVTEGLTGTAKGRSVLRNDDLILDSALRSLRSADPQSLHDFSKFYLSSFDLADNVTVRNTLSSNPISVRRIDANNVEISIGKRAPTYSNEKKSIQGLIDGLNSVIPEGAKRNARKTGDYYVSKLKGSPTAFGLPEGVNKTSWIKAVVADLGGSVNPSATGLDVVLPSGVRSFVDADEAIAFIARHTIDQASATNDLTAQGIRIFKTSDGAFVARTLDSGKEITRAADFGELLNNLDYQPSKLDIRYGPKVIGVSEEGITFELSGNVYAKSKKDALKAIGKFENKALQNQRKILKRVSSKDLSIQPDGLYRVKLKDYDYVKTFNNNADARKFFEQEVSSIEDLKEMANKKMLNFDIENGKYILYDGEVRHEMNTLSDLKTKMSDYPDISESVPDLVPLDPEIEAALPELLAQFNASSWLKKQAGSNAYGQPPEFPFEENIKEMSSWQTFRKNTSEFFNWVETTANRTNRPFLVEWSNKMQRQIRRARLDNGEVAKYLEDSFRGSNGKILNRESRRKIFYHGSAQAGSEEADLLSKLYKESYQKELSALNPDEQAALLRLKELYGTLGRKFGIDYEKLVNNYMPRLRRHLEGLTEEQKASFPSMSALADSVPDWHNNVPKEIRFWAENERTADLPQYFLKDDAFEVALMYSAQGHKKKYLNAGWQEIDRYRKDSGLEEGIYGRLQMYKSDLMGGFHSDGEKAVAEIGQRFFRNLKRGPLEKLIPFSEPDMAQFGHDILGNMMSLNYFSSLGWKPFLAIRNTVQPLTTLAPRFGLDWTLKAWKDVLDNPQVTFEKLRDIGILKDKPPIVNSLFGGESRTGRFTQLAFMWFKNSDDITRAIAYRAATMRLDNAVAAKTLNAALSPAKFAELAGLDRINPITAQGIMKLVQEGNVEGAKDMFGDTVQRLTMFDYSGATTPAMHRGLIGKLFGQYGTYSAGYRANMGDMLRYGSTKQKLESVATYLAISGALWAGFEAMRIKTNDFIPLAPGIFTGGPGFDNAINIIKAQDPGFEGQQARAALKRDLPTFIPGSSQWKAIKRAIDYTDSGDSYAAILSLLNAPVVQ